ncbi:Co2+/Mg2+ efflux protein ApaG [Neolewinella lacunae]|uniref:Co2+/Mg2+ efflux protein ApaG n=1 Tax=Neolewinella lacunae TaxID=1517758 RepID=A0A923T9R5_9BACT|nr:Co2+/Mg2+ efflux protein ApaG [Neolewinella lacunae]MBC6995816.1 Co2+/Mg2+ efflux protein ApaG [Neolewinella lacunae]MDN3636491.1 Co2+/Mg2+ efflux protein ApaG [Neolewinella lacunae]
MTSQTTQEVTVTADSFFQAQYSDPARLQYVYSYRIRIENNGTRTVQLLSRAWEVIDATGARRVVEGEGVVGQQPHILPGTAHEYTSWVQFETPIGAMQGSYLMRRSDRQGQEELFQVEVPKFLHIAPEVLN